MRSFATEENPELAMSKQQLAALQAQLSKLAGADQDSNSFIVPKQKVPEAGMEYIRKYRDVKYYETIYELIAKQFEMAKLDEARQGAVIQVADVAVPPDRRYSPRRVTIVLVTMLIAFGVSIFVAFASEQWELAQRDPEQKGRIGALRNLLSAKQ
jgi:uncharacterized protein involved in exopolysaccharide biosynthesis